MNRTALQTLKDIVRKRAGNMTDEAVEGYLNGEMRNGLQNESGDVCSTWSRIRSATTRLRRKIDCRWYVNTDHQIGVSLNGFPVKTSEVERVLRNAVREMYRQQLIRKSD